MPGSECLEQHGGLEDLEEEQVPRPEEAEDSVKELNASPRRAGP